jgi:hypothetical protein
MLNFLRKKAKKNKVIEVAQQQLEENRAIIESLRDYDIGKKDISTRNVERRLPDIRVTP